MQMPPRSDRETGFTLIELAVAMVLFGIVVAIGAGPYKRYNDATQQSGITRRVVATLRAAQVSAVSENVTYRADFTPSSVKVYRSNEAGGWTLTSTMTENESAVTIASTTFTLPNGTSSASCFFYPRGTASSTPSGIVIARTNASKKYTIKVEGLTARVSYA